MISLSDLNFSKCINNADVNLRGKAVDAIVDENFDPETYFINNEFFYLKAKLFSSKLDREELQKILTVQEKKYYNRLFRNKFRQNQMLAGRLILKLMLNESYKLSKLSSIGIIKTEDGGKPHIFLKERMADLEVNDSVISKNHVWTKSDFDCSITHCENLAVVAISSRFLIGIDVENYKTKLETSLLNTAFSSDELESWTANSSYEDTTAIWIKLWTLKESIIKALGANNFGSIRSFEVLLVERDLVEIRTNISAITLSNIKNMKLFTGILNGFTISLCLIM